MPQPQLSRMSGQSLIVEIWWAGAPRTAYLAVVEQLFEDVVLRNGCVVDDIKDTLAANTSFNMSLALG